jgi:hypothetical protein
MGLCGTRSLCAFIPPLLLPVQHVADLIANTNSTLGTGLLPVALSLNQTTQNLKARGVRL